MIKIYTRPGCAQCPTVKRICDTKNANYEELPAEGEEYERLAALIGYNVPLVKSTESDTLMMGLQVPTLFKIIKEDQGEA